MVPFVDGFGVEFDPQRHWDHVRIVIVEYERERSEPGTPPAEPVWKDHPAGRSKCPVLFEDTEQGKGHYS